MPYPKSRKGHFGELHHPRDQTMGDARVDTFGKNKLKKFKIDLLRNRNIYENKEIYGKI